MVYLIYIYCVCVLGLGILVNIIGNSLYAYWQLSFRHQVISHPYRKNHKYRPKITVLITHRAGHELDIKTHLNQLRTTRYPHLELLIASELPSKKLKKVIHNSNIKRYTQQIKTVYIKSLDNQKLLFRLAKRETSGELILILNAGVQIKPDIFKLAVAKFNSNSSLDALMLNDKIDPNYQVISWYISTAKLISNLSLKTRSTLHFINSIEPYQTVLISSSAFSKTIRHGLRSLNIEYLSQAQTVRLSDPLRNYLKQSFFNQRAILARYAEVRLDTKLAINAVISIAYRLATTALLGLLSYFAYLAIRLYEPSFLLIALAALALIFIYAITQEDSLDFTDKLSYISLAPAYFIWYLFSLIIEFIYLLVNVTSLGLLTFWHEI